MNGYRDEREALRARTEALEHELEHMKQQLDATRGSESARERLERLERELGTAQAEVRSMQNGLGGPRPSVARVFGFVAAGTALATLVCAVNRPRHYAQPTVVASMMPAMHVEPAGLTVDVPSDSVESRSIEPVWNGTVKSATGIDLRPGQRCALKTTIQRSGVSDLRVVCGTRPLYDSKDARRKTAPWSWELYEDPSEEAGQFRYLLEFDDTASPRATRTRASINTGAQSAVVWREGVGAFRVEVSLSELSEPLDGAFFESTDTDSKCPRFFSNATVLEATGDQSLAAGSTCEVSVRPHSAEQCRVRVKCGANLLYGEGNLGYARLVTDGDEATSIQDDEFSSSDKDPAIDLDLKSRRLVVTDEGVTSWRVTLQLAKPFKPATK